MLNPDEYTFMTSWVIAIVDILEVPSVRPTSISRSTEETVIYRVGLYKLRF